MKRLGIVGATGLVGQTVLRVLQEEKMIDKFELFLFVSEKSSGKVIVFNDRHYTLLKLDSSILDFNLDYAIFLTDESISEIWVSKLAEKGTVVIDNSSAFRLEKSVPLVVPEINVNIIQNKSKIIANPNCSTIQLVVVLDRLLSVAKQKKVIVSSYQSVSGAGREALEDLKNHTNNYFANGIVDNIIPKIGRFTCDGNCSEEDKIINETKKILGQDFEVYATAVRVPTSFCHGESIYVEFDKPVEMCEIKNALRCEYIEYSEDLFYPTECVSTNMTYVFRLRKVNENTIMFFVLADNLRRGAAYNAVKILDAVSEN